MRRRRVLRAGAVGLSGCVAGCISGLGSNPTGVEVRELEVWNEAEGAHAFAVSVAGDERAYERTVELSGTPAGTYTRTVLSDAPSSAVTAVRAAVGDQRARADLTQYDESVAVVSPRCSIEGELAIPVYP